MLAIGVQLANQWAAAIAAACKPVTTAVPMISIYFVPPSKIMTTVCSGFIRTSAMLNYAALALAFAAMTIGIPHTVSSLLEVLSDSHSLMPSKQPISPGRLSIQSRAAAKKSTREFPVLQKEVAARERERCGERQARHTEAAPARKERRCRRERRNQGTQPVQRPTARLGLPSTR